VSLRSLARRLGVSHAAPANHFPDKAALFTAIAVEGFRLLASEGWAAGRDPQAVAYLAWSVVHGLAALWLGGSLQRSQRPFEEIAGEVGALLASALSPQPAPAT
jgi:AcrR family transcriptional regulator